MITEYDLRQAIAECQGERNPTANTCIKMAAFLTIQRELYGREQQEPSYSFAAGPGTDVHTIDYRGESEFSRAINGKRDSDVWAVMDDMMDTVRVMLPKLYDAVLRKLQM